MASLFRTVVSAGLGFFSGGPAGALLSIGGSILGDALGNKKQQAAPPAPPPVVEAPPPLPLPDDKAVQDAKRRSIAAQITRRGRQSTILSTPASSDTLG